VVNGPATDGRPAAPAPPKPLSLSSWLLRAAGPPLAAALVVLGLVALAGPALEWLRGRERYFISFSDIECQPPGGLSREEFLQDVQYIAGLPDAPLDVLDDGLAARLEAAFARHPWVERVLRVDVGPRRVRVSLTYRTAVLTVPLAGGPPRAVDGGGVLLPEAATDPEAPTLRGPVRRPAGPPGEPWGDERVAAAARTAAALRPHQAQLKITSLDVVEGEIQLQWSPGTVVWGRPPGDEAAGEATADEKVRRLLEFAGGHDGGRWAVDLRPATGAVVKQLD
jgi:hypothetical protein